MTMMMWICSPTHHHHHRSVRMPGILTCAYLQLLWILLLFSLNSPSSGRRSAFLKHAERRTKVKLVDGPNSFSGHVMVYHRGQWGLVCDDGWDIFAARVVCRMLGYTTALSYSTEAKFGTPETDKIWLDNVRCYGTEGDIMECEYHDWGIHNCKSHEAAGVYCSTTRIDTTPKPTTTIATPVTQENSYAAAAGGAETLMIGGRPLALKKLQINNIRLINGRFPEEGRLEVNVAGKWGTVCADHWTLREAEVICRHLELGHAKSALKAPFFGGQDSDKLVGDVHCEGHEGTFTSCMIGQMMSDVICPEANLIAGVICTNELPDLIPNATLLETSTYLQDLPMYNMECALEESCAAMSAYYLIRETRNWRHHSRRLLRFSSSVFNNGTADFHPFIPREQWEWHMCHMHFHSMDVFAHYDLLDPHGNRVAEGHKASFCLEDVVCQDGVRKNYACQGYGAQGISVGCADEYLHSIDCQWIDITDVAAGNYTFRIHVNPQLKVAELDYDNNAVRCSLYYSGNTVHVSDCVNSRN